MPICDTSQLYGDGAYRHNSLAVAETSQAEVAADAFQISPHICATEPNYRICGFCNAVNLTHQLSPTLGRDLFHRAIAVCI